MRRKGSWDVSSPPAFLPGSVGVEATRGTDADGRCDFLPRSRADRAVSPSSRAAGGAREVRPRGDDLGGNPFRGDRGGFGIRARSPRGTHGPLVPQPPQEVDPLPTSGAAGSPVRAREGGTQSAGVPCGNRPSPAPRYPGRDGVGPPADPAGNAISSRI